MTEHTPTTDDVRVRASHDTARFGLVQELGFDFPFDRWLAAHDVEVKAEALHDAADALGPLVDAQHPAALNPDTWLRDRADRIESEATR